MTNAESSISKDWNSNNLNKFYLIALILIGFYAFLMGIIYGLSIEKSPALGAWLVLGGPPLFFPINGPQILFGIGILIGYLKIPTVISMKKTSDRIQIQETSRFRLKAELEFQEKDLLYVSIESGGSGKRIWWCIPLGLHMAYMLTDGFALLLNPNTFGYGILNAWSYIMAGGIDAIILILFNRLDLVFMQIETNTHYLNISLNATNDEIKTILNFKIDPKQFSVNNNMNLIIGIIFALVAIASRIFNIFFGSAVRLPLFLFAIILIIWGWKNRKHEVFHFSDKYISSKGHFIGESLIWIFGGLILITIGGTIGAWIYFLPTYSYQLINTIFSVLISIGIVIGIFVLWKNTLNPIKK